MGSVNFRIIVLLFFLILFWGLAILNIAIISLPNNPLRGIMGTKKSLVAVIPEGWGFFTRNPREDVLFTFIKKNNQWIPYDKQNNAAPENLFGLKRTARVNGLIYATYFKNISASDWKLYKNLDLDNLKSVAFAPKKVKNSSKYLDFCGETLLFVKTKTIPWAWSSAGPGLPIGCRYRRTPRPWASIVSTARSICS